MQIGERIRAARHRRGLTLEQVAEMCGISKQSVSKYELGRMRPDMDVLMALSKSLDVTFDFLLSSPRVSVSPEQVDHRRFSDLGKRKTESLIVCAQDAAERRLIVEEIVYGDERPRYDGLKNVPVADLEDAETCAKEVRDRYGLGSDPIGNLTHVIEDHEVRLTLAPFEFERSDGLGFWIDERTPFIVYGGEVGDRLRFTLAHEFAHRICEFAPELDSERASNRFAGALLVPEECVLEHGRSWLSHWDALVQAKEEYGASLQALLFRCFDCGVIDYAIYQVKQKQLSRKGWRTEEPGHVATEAPSRFEELVLQAMSEGKVGEARAAELMGVTLEQFRAGK